MEQSKLLETAEDVVISFRKVVDESVGDQIAAAGALIQLTVAINKLAEEVTKGKAMVGQFAKLKEMLMIPTPAASEEKPTEVASSHLDAEKLLSDILSKISQPK